jgi:penicillin amidase
LPESDDDSTSIEDKNQTGLTGHLSRVAFLGSGFFELNESYRKFFGINGSHIGSNSWVISSGKSLSGKPLLANDPHLALQAPSRWYEVTIKGGELDAHGMTLPGVPGVVIGNNRFIAWGLTNLMNDDNDFIVLNIDSSNSRKYIYANRSNELDSIKEKIYVKDSMESDYVVRTTIIGPVISGLNARGFAYSENRDFKTAEGKIMTFRWTGFENSDDVLSFYRLNHSKNWDDFRSALKDFCVPAQNFIYADVYGNIGYQAAGRVPVRRTSEQNNYLFPSDQVLDWDGFVDFDKMPGTFNPKEGFIATANTNPFDWLKDGKEKFYISYLWESSSRFDKITSFLSSRSKFDTDDCRLLQNSYESPYAARIAQIAASDLDSAGTGDIKWIAERFRYWNGEMQPGESIGSVYNTFLAYLLKNTFKDELGENAFIDFLVVQNMPYRSLELIMDENTNIWFDNINTQKTETRGDIIRQSMNEAIEFLKSRFENQDINTWHWGELHKVKFMHPLGSVADLDKSFNIGPYPVGGDQTTINNTEYKFESFLKNRDFNVVVGPSMRMIIDLADIEHPLTINSTGSSGQPVEKNYSSESRKWLYGEYKKNFMNEMEILAKNSDVLRLIPAN